MGGRIAGTFGLIEIDETVLQRCSRISIRT
jgi:hypothetical protein